MQPGQALGMVSKSRSCVWLEWLGIFNHSGRLMLPSLLFQPVLIPRGCGRVKREDYWQSLHWPVSFTAHNPTASVTSEKLLLLYGPQFPIRETALNVQLRQPHPSDVRK